jgi:hypothetical protein
MDEMEGLAIKITRAEWGVLKGWVPEIVANEVAGKLVEVIRPILADAIAAKDATIAAQAAEIERLTADVSDAAMLIRRLAYRCPGLAVAHQANDWLKRKGLQGSLLKETEEQC